MGVSWVRWVRFASFWKGALGTALEATAKDQLILDCRSAAYAKSWVTSPSQTLAVRVERVAADGSRKVVSHMAKHYRGLFARYLIQSVWRLVHWWLHGYCRIFGEVSEDRWSVPCRRRVKAGILTLLVHELGCPTICFPLIFCIILKIFNYFLGACLSPPPPVKPLFPHLRR